MSDIFNPDHVILGGQAFTDYPEALPVVSKALRATSVITNRDVRVARSAITVQQKAARAVPSTRSTPSRSKPSASPPDAVSPSTRAGSSTRGSGQAPSTRGFVPSPAAQGAGQQVFRGRGPFVGWRSPG